MYKFVLSIIGIACVAATILFGNHFYYGTVECVTTQVTDKERINDDQSSKYLIFTEQEVFQNTDSVMHFKFNSSDIYGEISTNQTYSIEVYGWRAPFLSMYRNIISLNCSE